MANSKPSQGTRQETGYGCLTRLCWMMFGNIGLIAFAVAIAKHKDGFLSYSDLGFWLVVLFMIGVWYFDITKMDGLTASEKPASVAIWRWYVFYLIIFGLVVWGIAHLVGYYY